MMKTDPAYPGPPNKIVSGVMGFICLLGAFGLTVWGSNAFSRWLGGALGNRGLLIDALAAFLPFLVFIGLYFLSLFILILVTVMLRKGVSRLLGGDREKEPDDGGSRVVVTGHRRNKDEYSSVAGLEGTVEEKPEAPKTDPFYAILCFFGLVVWSLGFKCYSETQNQIGWAFWPLYGLGVLLLVYLFHEALHYRHAAVRRYIPARPISPQRRLAAGIVACVIFVGLSAGTTWVIQEKLKRDTQPATGVVTRLVYHPGYRSGHTNVEVKFTDLNHQTLTVECWGGTFYLRDLPNPGAQVQVLYDPHNPSEATLQMFGDQLGLPIFLGGIGLFAFILAVLRARREGF